MTPAGFIEPRPPGPVTLIDGRVVHSTSEDWRAECEARAVAHMTTTQQRHEYVAVVERARGKTAADALRDLATRIRLKEVLHRED